MSVLADRIESVTNAPSVLSQATRTRVEHWREWVLLDGDRLRIALGLSALLCCTFFAIEIAESPRLQRAQPLFYLFGSLIGGNITLVTVVVSISQLLLGRQINTPGDLRSRIDATIDYRRDVEAAADGVVAPVDPFGFLWLLFENTRQQAQSIGGLLIGTHAREYEAGSGLVLEEGVQQAHDRIDESVSAITDHTDEVLELLNGSNTDVFSVLSVTLTTNYANQINEIRQVRSAYREDLSETELERLDSLIDRLQEIDIARQYFKGIYLQQELSKLSRLLLMVAIPAEVVSVYGLLAFTVPMGATVLTAYPLVLIPIAITIGFLPLSVLFSFVLRAATVTDRTAATIPFTTPEQEV